MAWQWGRGEDKGRHGTSHGICSQGRLAKAAPAAAASTAAGSPSSTSEDATPTPAVTAPARQLDRCATWRQSLQCNFGFCATCPPGRLASAPAAACHSCYEHCRYVSSRQAGSSACCYNSSVPLCFQQAGWQQPRLLHFKQCRHVHRRQAGGSACCSKVRAQVHVFIPCRELHLSSKGT